MDRVQGKVAVVTGGAQRVGRAVALLLAREGAAVAVADVEETAGEAVAGEIRAAGGNARFWRLDVSHEEEVRQVLGEAASSLGGVDILVNCASIDGQPGRSDEISEADWDAVMAINVKGAFFCTKHAVPLMRAGRRGGSVINLSSIYGIVGSSHSAPYHASKGALRIMTKTDALAYAADRIRVNSVHPGFIWAATQRGTNDAHVAPEMVHSEMAKLHPLGTLGEPEDVAYAVLYLASDEAKFVTGAELVVDGGYTAR